MHALIKIPLNYYINTILTELVEEKLRFGFFLEIYMQINIYLYLYKYIFV